MMKVLITLSILLFASSAYTQTVKIGTMIKYLNATKAHITDDLLNKGFSFNGKKEEKHVDSYLDLFYWTNSRISDEDLTKVFEYNLNELNEKATIKTISVRYRTASSADYLLLKKELPTLGFKFINEGDYKGELVSVYNNTLYTLSIWVSSDGKYDLSVKKL